jgi:hypothetical protein
MLEVCTEFSHLFDVLTNLTRVFYDDTADLQTYFANLKNANKLPSLNELLEQADTIIDRYASTTAYERALSGSESLSPHPRFAVSVGTPWDPKAAGNSPLMENDDSALPTDATKPLHKESEGFDGDRVLANGILFRMDFSLWIEFTYAISEGDTGRMYEILKVCCCVQSLTQATYFLVGLDNYLRRHEQHKLCHISFRCLLPSSLRIVTCSPHCYIQ